MLKAKEAAATTAMDAKLMISGQIREQSMAQTVYYSLRDRNDQHFQPFIWQLRYITTLTMILTGRR